MFNDDECRLTKKEMKQIRWYRKKREKYEKRVRKTEEFIRVMRTDDLRKFYFILQHEVEQRTD